MNYLENASWLDAEYLCNDRDGHLWSLNSFDEWWNVFQSVQHSSMNEEAETYFTNLIMISTLLFIGLTRNELVRYRCCGLFNLVYS